jgi:hypothetical protein
VIHKAPGGACLPSGEKGYVAWEKCMGGPAIQMIGFFLAAEGHKSTAQTLNAIAGAAIITKKWIVPIMRRY